MLISAFTNPALLLLCLTNVPLIYRDLPHIRYFLKLFARRPLPLRPSTLPGACLLSALYLQLLSAIAELLSLPCSKHAPEGTGTSLENHEPGVAMGSFRLPLCHVCCCQLPRNYRYTCKPRLTAARLQLPSAIAELLSTIE